MARQDIIRLSKQTLIYGFGYVIARMINFLLLPFYSHHMLPGEYGVISLVYAFIAFLNIIYHYGLESAFLRFYSGSGTGGATGGRTFSPPYSCPLLPPVSCSRS
ncbi:MAG: hypothetical protein U5N26_08660 [Candidatus Marinimicrobia bacterium]|nr:hypothetical protein [Candidatus Neomarinimicrobiota bacterium]